jgi:hypothetical protein
MPRIFDNIDNALLPELSNISKVGLVRMVMLVAF